MVEIDISTISFATWCRNHEAEHNSKWCRELYPWQVFTQVDYKQEQTGEPQCVELSGTIYVATIKKQWMAENGRWNVRVSLETDFASRSEEWEHRSWRNTFQLVFGEGGYFITIFTKENDPSKKMLGDFMRGRFDRIETKRSKPLSSLFFKSLISYSAESVFGDLAQYKFHSANNFAPFLSLDTELWISFSFTEEKAHQVGIRCKNSCKRMIVVYCHPTFSKHHRCDSAEILSLPEFLELASSDVRRRFLPQVRFLINHLHVDSSRTTTASEELSAEILSAEEGIQEISTSVLREAKSGLGTCIETVADAAYFFASANLLNAALNERLGVYEGTQALRKEVYSFKARVGHVFEQLIVSPIDGVEVYIDGHGATFAEIDGIQMSFHAIPQTAILQDFRQSLRNRPRPWSKIRLQRKAPLVLVWASALVHEELKRGKTTQDSV